MSPAARTLTLAIRGYRRVRPAWIRCPNVPSCSAYGLAAVEEWGALRGGWLALRRIVACRPGVPPGHDSVPRGAGGMTGAGEGL